MNITGMADFGSLDLALDAITQLIRVTAGKKGFHTLRHTLLGNKPDDEVHVVKDVISDDEKSELQLRLETIKSHIAKASSQFQISYQDILKNAMARNKLEMLKRQRLERSQSTTSNESSTYEPNLSPMFQTQPPTPQLLDISGSSNDLSMVSLQPFETSGGHMVLSDSPVLVQSDFSLPNPVQLVNIMPAVPISISLPSEPISSAALPISLNSIPPTPPLSTSSSTSSPSTSTGSVSIGEQRMLRYGRAILKLKHYKRALKYAIWDFQDGVTVEDAAKKQGITKEAIQYSINLIVSKTGETIEEFKNNRSSNCEVYPGQISEAYKGRVKDGTQRVKQKKCQNLFACAVACDISLFDLMDSLIKELEIETKILSLQPVPELTPTPPGNQVIDPQHDDILSDIDEVIREDSVEGQQCISANNEVVQLQLTNCDVCKKMFFDAKSFQEHEDAGCIDY